MSEEQKIPVLENDPLTYANSFTKAIDNPVFRAARNAQYELAKMAGFERTQTKGEDVGRALIQGDISGSMHNYKEYYKQLGADLSDIGKSLYDKGTKLIKGEEKTGSGLSNDAQTQAAQSKGKKEL